MDEFRIRPAVPGAPIRDPATRDILAADGEMKPRSPHWLRLLNRGDVEIAPDEQAVSPEPAAEADPAAEHDPPAVPSAE